MAINDISFDINNLVSGFRDSFFKTAKIILVMIFNLPMWVKIPLAIISILLVIGIAILTWKNRDEWRHVKC